ncbi:MAG TPA: MASE4 domain-containing protein [Caulobacteraceae bacterium]|jgi:signal transduction histidine kinase/CheY-like chemotaxis protein|nr:MASE4 domain-containing protein [Caulobacteraceae bacterium]
MNETEVRGELGAGLAAAPTVGEKRIVAITTVAVSFLCLLLIAPFAEVDLPPLTTFATACGAALCMTDLITALLLFGQFFRMRTAGLLVLASGYLFCSLMALTLTLGFPSVSPSGAPSTQATAWLYVFWRGLFPLFVVAYAVFSGPRMTAHPGRLWRKRAAAIAILAVCVLTAVAVFSASRAGSLLPPITVANGRRAYSTAVLLGLFTIDLIALASMWRRRMASVLDFWVIVVLCAWFLDIGLSDALGGHRYDLGWYAGRIYGLLASSFVLGALLSEQNKLYGRLADALQVSEHANDELIRSREELGRVQRLEALVQLTGGVAHDFNNLLTAIITSLDIIRRKPDDKGGVARLADNAGKAAQRGAELIKRMLSFARKQQLKPEVLNPNAILTELGGLAARTTGAHVKLELELDSTVHPVCVDAAELQAAVLNLITNARDAMPDGGVISISTRNIELEAGDVGLIDDMAPGAFVRIAVSDTGVGMDADTLAHVFEPFFSTKPTGQGTGLGLSQVYGFARDARGKVDITTCPGEGSTVAVVLPRSVQGAATGVLESVPLRRAVEGETVLVVEDDVDVIASVRESLLDLGYRVLVASNADEALEILRPRSRRIDMLFSDVVMPGGMNGVQLAVEARRLRRGLKVLLTSGYAGSVLKSHDIPADTEMLAKPYPREELARKIRLVLGNKN